MSATKVAPLNSAAMAATFIPATMKHSSLAITAQNPSATTVAQKGNGQDHTTKPCTIVTPNNATVSTGTGSYEVACQSRGTRLPGQTSTTRHLSYK